MKFLISRFLQPRVRVSPSSSSISRSSNHEFAFRHLRAAFQGSCYHEFAFRHLPAAFQGLSTTSSHFAIFEQHFRSTRSYFCMILARSNEFASKWPRFSSRTNWKRFQRSWRWILGEKQFRGYRKKFWSILEIRGQCYINLPIASFTFGISFIPIAYLYWVILRGVEIMWRLGNFAGIQM